MRKALMLAASAALVVGVTAAWKVQRDRDAQVESWLARAAVSPQEAERRALSAYPGGSIVESEIEEENGRLIHSLEVDVPGAGVVEVEIDAMTGELLPPDAEGDDDDDDDDHGGADDDDDERRGG